MSMREKSQLKQRINKEHNSNFRAGYVHVEEEQLHKTGIRGRKIYFFYVVICLLFLAIIVNILVSVFFLLLSDTLLTVVLTCMKAGDNSFVVAAATLWNALPNNTKTSACLATFKARLKTHFFLTVLAA